MHFPNPFLPGSGPPTEGAQLIVEAFKAGWGGAILKTVALEPNKEPSPCLCSIKKRRGFGMIDGLTRGLSGYLDEHGYSSLDETRGKALPQIKTFFDLDLSLRQVAVVDSERCTGCELCVTACASGALQAIEMTGDLAEVNVERCDGCGLCVGVCPVDAIHMEGR